MTATVLIAEPNEHLRDILESTIAKRGFATIAVDSVEAARTALIQQDIHAAVIDLPLYPHLSLAELRRGEWTGLQLVREIRMVPTMAEMPILVLGTLESKDGSYRRMAQESGADEYLLKPFATQAVASFFEAAFRKRAAS